MWNKREEEMRAQAPRPTAQPATRPITPPSPTGFTGETVDSGRTAVIGSSMKIKGEIYSSEELFVDGEIEGKLELQHRLTVGPNGKVRATIKAREVVVQGSVHGNVQSTDKITIRKNATLVGDIKTAGIVIDDGAYFKGSIDITRAETPRIVTAEPELVRTADAVA